MPLTVRKFNAQVKDPQSGQMVPAGLLSSDSLQAIEAAESAAITEIQQKGAETKASIPDNYTELSDSVGELKEAYNLYDPTATYVQRKVDGSSGNGYTINADGSITCIRSNGQYGGLYLVDNTRTLKAGTYTISGKMTCTKPGLTSTKVGLKIGSGSGVSTDMTTERGVSTVIASGTTEGWFTRNFTIEEDTTFAFMCIPWASTSVDSSYPATISSLMITEGSTLREYSPNTLTARDEIARSAIDTLQNTVRTGDYNLYDPNATYNHARKDGSSASSIYTTTVGGLTVKGTVYSNGVIMLFDNSRTLKAGNYTISGKLTMTKEGVQHRNITLLVGTSFDPVTVTLCTERGGDTAIEVGATEGWFAYTFTLTDDDAFAFCAEPTNGSMADSSNPATISNFMITATASLTEYSADTQTVYDVLARVDAQSAIDKANAIGDTFNGEYSTGVYDYDTPLTAYGALFKGKNEVESFAYFSDPHILGAGDTNRNTAMKENYLKRVQKTFNNSPCSFLICGGDWLNNSTTMDEACYRLGNLKGIADHLLDGCKLVMGNHDTNYQGKLDAESDNGTGRLADATIASIMYRDTDTQKAYYSFDGANSKCYVIDTGSDSHSTMLAYDWEQVDWLAGKLAEDDPEHGIIFLHIIKATELQIFASTLGQLVQAYNAHSSITLNSVAYDFSGCTGRVEFWVGGHTHRDENGTLGGIPYIITATDSYNDDNTGVSDVPLIDLMLADYDGRKLYTVRVGGVGEDRVIDLVV